MEINKIYNIDCIQGMKQIDSESIDMIFCDLPYGKTKNKWDNVIPYEPMWKQFERIIKPNGAILLFGQDKFTARTMLSNEELHRYNIIWKKTTPTGFLNANRMPLRTHEDIMVFNTDIEMPDREDIMVFYKSLPTYNPQMTYGVLNHKKGGGNHKFTQRCYGKMKDTPTIITNEKYPISVLDFNREKECYHPTQKPVNLISWLVRTYTNEGDVVLDNCSGSGTTAIACIKEKRHFVCFEKDENYWKKSVERVKNEQRQLTLF